MHNSELRIAVLRADAVLNTARTVVQEYQDVWFGNPVLDPALFTSCYAVQLDGFVQISPPTIQVCSWFIAKLYCCGMHALCSTPQGSPS